MIRRGHLMLMKYCSIIARFSRVYLSQKLKKIQVGFSEQIVLMFLAHHSSINQECISKFFLIDKGAIAKTLTKLEEKAFIVRKGNPENKRENIIMLTDEGTKIQHHMKAALDEWNDAIYEGLSPDEIALAEKLMQRISANAAALTTAQTEDIDE